MCLPRCPRICTSGGHRGSPLTVTTASSVSSRRHSSKARSSSRWKYRAMTLRMASSSVTGLHQLDAVAERIVGVAPVVPVQGLVVHHREPGLCEGGGQPPQVVHDEGDVGLCTRLEVVLDAQ